MSMVGLVTFSGQVKFMPDNLAASKFQIAIEVKSVYTGNDERDTHLQEEEYLMRLSIQRSPLFLKSSPEKQSVCC